MSRSLQTSTANKPQSKQLKTMKTEKLIKFLEENLNTEKLSWCNETTYSDENRDVTFFFINDGLRSQGGGDHNFKFSDFTEDEIIEKVKKVISSL